MSASLTLSDGRAGVFPVSSGMYPPEGSRAVSCRYDWTLLTSYNEDLSQLVARGVETTIQTAFIDNFSVSQYVTIFVPGTGQTLRIPPYKQGFFPLLATGSFRISIPRPEASSTGVILCNVPSQATGVWPKARGPSLDLDFMTGTLDPRVSFTRASTATYTDASGTIQTAAVNAPRWDYKSGVLQGLLIEEQRTNLLYPGDGFFAPSTASGSTEGTVLNVGTGPTGANNAMALIPGAFSGVHQFYSVPGLLTSTTYTFSLFCKAAGMNFVQLALENVGFTQQFVCFNLQLGTIDRQSSNALGTIRAVGNGWYRCSVTATSTATPPMVNNIYPSAVGNLNGAFLSTGDNVNGIWVAGQQIEQGAFPTSYIPTTSASVTRAADNCVISSANMSPWFVPPGGSWFAEFIPISTVSNNNRIIGQPTPGGVAPLYDDTTRHLGNWDSSSAVVTANVIAPNVINKGVSSYAPNSGRVCLNAGSIVINVAMTTGFGILSSFGIGILSTTSGASESGYIRRVSYWPRVLSDAEMRVVTT